MKHPFFWGHQILIKFGQFLVLTHIKHRINSFKISAFFQGISAQESSKGRLFQAALNEEEVKLYSTMDSRRLGNPRTNKEAFF